MTRAQLACHVIGAMIFPLLAFAADPAGESAEDIRRRVGSGNPALGRTKSEAELCQGCHGEAGTSEAVGVPSLSGQYAAYIVKQLLNFRSLERKHRIMNAMAEGLADADIPDIAAYFASQPKMKGEGEASDQAAKDLFLYGDVNRNIDACVSCHDLGGKGRMSRDVAYPVIGGQRKSYLRVQLLNWKIGARTNTPQGVMNRIAAALSEAEITALAAYISAL